MLDIFPRFLGNQSESKEKYEKFHENHNYGVNILRYRWKLKRKCERTKSKIRLKIENVIEKYGKKRRNGCVRRCVRTVYWPKRRRLWLELLPCCCAHQALPSPCFLLLFRRNWFRVLWNCESVTPLGPTGLFYFSFSFFNSRRTNHFILVRGKLGNSLNPQHTL